ncbi:MAG TPA: flagellar assembly protein FliW [Deltaproteobacteria bacterium]|nr:flagellar assembly protein FliW [Deltaproteobacteria bacterium]HPR55503.1 flagellar assembly protein FliW [Deltaproteobacteria bacterium]HXK48624.1 flagellar assembly protein FliW [Deltaproteobacteria bacterium]
MDIDTLRFGKIKVEEEKIITFPRGILGFARNKRYILFPHSEGSPFFWLQSLEDGELAFVVMNPRLVKNDYSIDVDENVMKELDVKKEDSLEVVCIVTIPRNDPRGMTINLLGPIIINSQNRSAVQIICDKQSYSHRHPLIASQPAQQ